MKFRLKIFIIIGSAFCGLLSSGLSGQVQPKENAPRPFSRIPSMFHRQLSVLGDRVRAAGKEQSVYAGEVVDAAGKRSQARVIYQTPGLVRLDGFKSAGTLSFDGERAAGVISRDDESVLETFIMDLPEGMLASVERGAAVRFLGEGFGPGPRKVPKYTGPRYDIFEVTTPIRSRTDRVPSSKLYYFESQTGLLASTRYYDRSRSLPVKIETRFSAWQMIDGSAYPSRIDHYEAGQLMFSFIANRITAAPGLEPAQFR